MCCVSRIALFIIFTADVTWYLPPIVFILQYADDTRILKQIIDDDDRAVQKSEIDYFVDWSGENDLQLNQKKTYSVSYVKRGRITYGTHYYINHNEMANVPNIVGLGLTMASELTFKPHSNNIFAWERVASNLE